MGAEPEKSSLEVPGAPVASIFVILHHEPHWHLTRTHTYADGKRDTLTMDQLIDGHEVVSKLSKVGKVVLRPEDGDYFDSTRMYWESKTLVLDEKITGPAGKATNFVKYTLSDDTKTLIILEREETPAGNATNKWVYERQQQPISKP